MVFPESIKQFFYERAQQKLREKSEEAQRRRAKIALYKTPEKAKKVAEGLEWLAKQGKPIEHVEEWIETQAECEEILGNFLGAVRSLKGWENVQMRAMVRPWIRRGFERGHECVLYFSECSK